MNPAKQRRPWRPGKLQQRVGQAGRRLAGNEGARIPWPQLLQAREQYVKWEAFAHWVRAIEDTEGDFPEWLAEIVDKRCPGFLQFVAEQRLDDHTSPPFFWYHLERWISERIFGRARREGWMNAVGYYAVRDLASLRDNAYWEYCERQWKRARPAAYPSFREWRKASEHCDDRVIAACEMRETEQELIKASLRISPGVLCKAVDRYVDWQVFAYWARTALESGHLLPSPVERELRQRCPGFLETEAAAQARHSNEEPYQRFNRMMRWIEDHEFARAKKQGSFGALIYQARLHPRRARVVDYWHHWETSWSKHPRSRYPSFEQWRAAADAYTFEPGES
ncbi:MAG TPA: hypothetical protein VMX16_06025 [Terriglobia bacterium]|nr:hypothetical protein [Terriglobia bacterium]